MISLDNISFDNLTSKLTSSLLGGSEVTIDEVLDSLTSTDYGDLYGTLTLAEDTSAVETPVSESVTEITGATTTSNVQAWDPRLARVDGFVAKSGTGDDPEHPLIIPFASSTAAGAFYDLVFTIQRSIDKQITADDYKKDEGNDSTSTVEERKNSETGEDMNGSEMVWRASLNIKNTVVNDGDSYGIASIVNPYTLTKLCGGLVKTGSSDNTNGVEAENHMYDVRDSRRFYGNVMDDKLDDVLSVSNPTTTNIITYSNRDHWGRTPYYFLDFVFCKYWNVIPNNHLITLRKYHAPVYDNLLFSNMYNKNGTVNTKNPFAPIATVVTYFGEDTGNSLALLFSFSAGTNWKDISAAVHTVSGETGDNPHATIDRMFENGGGFTGAESGIFKSILGGANFVTGKMFSYGKFVGLLSPDGYNISNDQAVFDKQSLANVDPTEQIYANRILGPVNRIDSTKAREAGITYDLKLSIVCQYVARPIGGVNTKAAMLDILSNCMEIASVEAMFWGGGYRFMIKPHLYPFKNTAFKNRIMDDLYAGRIFGKNGALAHTVEGVKKFGTTDKNGNDTKSFDWSNVVGKMQEFLGETLGALGELINSVSNTLFGDNANLGDWLKSAGNAAAGDNSAADKGAKKLNNLTSNINQMWRSLVILQSVAPNVQGMKALLTGEPVGNWHLTVGNPLNPIMVIGNLICTNMKVEAGEELGPDDFPLEIKVTYELDHGMKRDKAGIQSMFNRGSGKIYMLPDWIRASSDYESTVDAYTGVHNGANGKGTGTFYLPSFMNAGALMSKSGAHGYLKFKLGPAKKLAMSTHTENTVIAKFTPPSVDAAISNVKDSNSTFFGNNNSSRAWIRGIAATRKLMN